MTKHFQPPYKGPIFLCGKIVSSVKKQWEEEKCKKGEKSPHISEL